MTTTINKNTNIKIKNKNDSVIGVYDVGLTNWITLSDGQVIDRPKFLTKSLKKIKTLQRKLSKKKKGSLCTQS
jgi:putative transposase